MPRYIIKEGDSYILLLDHEIKYISSDDKYVVLHLTTGKNIPSAYNLEDLKEKLDKTIFRQLTEKIIVNVHQVQKVSDDTLSLLDGSKIYLGKDCKKQMLDFMIRI
jgi:DNA-binding LytR/AlgR family response regulator